MYLNTREYKLTMTFLDPVFISIGPIHIHYYGLVYAFGLLAVYYFLRYHKKSLSMSVEQITNCILWLVIGLLIGGRIGHFLFSQPLIFISNPLELLYIWQGGMSFFGALIGMSITGYYFARNQKISFFRLADYITIPVSAILIFGRIANFINQELVGRVSNVSWCVEFVTAVGCRHPYQLYAAISHTILFMLLLVIFIFAKKYWGKFHGMLFSYFIIGYSILRFITDFYRDDPIIIMGLTIWQIVSVVGILIGIIMGIYVTHYIHQNQQKYKSKKRG